MNTIEKEKQLWYKKCDSLQRGCIDCLYKKSPFLREPCVSCFKTSFFGNYKPKHSRRWGFIIALILLIFVFGLFLAAYYCQINWDRLKAKLDGTGTLNSELIPWPSGRGGIIWNQGTGGICLIRYYIPPGSRKIEIVSTKYFGKENGLMKRSAGNERGRS